MLWFLWGLALGDESRRCREERPSAPPREPIDWAAEWKVLSSAWFRILAGAVIGGIPLAVWALGMWPKLPRPVHTAVLTPGVLLAPVYYWLARVDLIGGAWTGPMLLATGLIQWVVERAKSSGHLIRTGDGR
jgi:hypothetical protein